MIIDAIANLSHYTKLFPTIPEALETMNSIERQELGKNIFSRVVTSSFKKERPNLLKKHNLRRTVNTQIFKSF